MAEASISEDHLRCPVCLDLLQDPVTIPCGHSYCLNCITDCWNQDDQTGVYSCPQCRQTFSPRPAVYKNVMFAEVVEKLKKTKLQTALPDHCYAGPGDVECDVCTGRKHKAVKSCLECLKSFCQNHLEQHENLFQFNEHHLMDPTGQLQEMLCSKHRKQLEIYCRTDQQCICYLCTMDEHKHHDTVTAVAERTEKQRLLGEMQIEVQQKIQEKENELQGLIEAVQTYKRSAQTAVKDSEKIFTDLIRSIERRRSEVTQLIRDQEQAAVSRAEGVLKQLQQEIDDLKRRNTELKQLSHTDNHIYFLQSFQSLSAAGGSTVSHSINVSSFCSFDDVTKSVSQLKDKLENFFKDEIEQISDRVTYMTVIAPNEPKTRREFLQYSSQFTLDINTVNKLLSLSDGNRTATYTHTVQQYPDHPERFNQYAQVLCRESVCGRCYWEVEWSGSAGVYISMSYKSISRKRKGNECILGQNNQSWSLYCSPSTYLFRHNSTLTHLSVSSSCSRIGVYVDHSAGTLSFYSVSDTMTLIYKVQTTFTQPLYPGFLVRKGSSVKLSSHKLNHTLKGPHYFQPIAKKRKTLEEQSGIQFC